MSEGITVAWHPHPDARLEAAIAGAGVRDLHGLLRHPAVRVDRYAHLRVLDRLHALAPDDPAVRAGWVQSMLLSNRPAPVWEVARHWPYADPALDRKSTRLNSSHVKIS